MLPICAVAGPASAPASAPLVVARVKPVLQVGGSSFRDLNANGAVDPYEDWRQPVERRVQDLVGRMTLVEKAGLMLIDTLNAGCEGAVTPRGFDYVNVQHMRRFILRNVVGPQPSCGPDTGFRAGSVVTPVQAAQFTNAVQALAEGGVQGRSRRTGDMRVTASSRA